MKSSTFLFKALIVLMVSILLTGMTGNLADPHIVFESQLHDYGTIKKNSDGTCWFAFANKGDAPLVITGVKASCGCTVPDYPKAPVLPGESGKIKVVYNTKSTGLFTKTVNVTCTDPVTPTVTLTITGTVVK